MVSESDFFYPPKGGGDDENWKFFLPFQKFKKKLEMIFFPDVTFFLFKEHSHEQ